MTIVLRPVREKFVKGWNGKEEKGKWAGLLWQISGKNWP